MQKCPLLEPGTIFAGDLRVVRPLTESGKGALYVVEELSTGTERVLKLIRDDRVKAAEMRSRFRKAAASRTSEQPRGAVEVIAASIDAPTGIAWVLMNPVDG